MIATGRRKANLKQSELEQQLGLTVQYVSKVERGAIRRPPDDVLQKFAEFLERDVADLIDACGREVDPSSVGATAESRRFQILMGHTVWAAPVLLALRHRDFAAFEFASFGSKNGLPRWLPAAVDDPPQDLPLPCGGLQEPTFSARDVSEFLRWGDVDFGLLPRNFVPDGGAFEPILDVMDSPSACLVSVPRALCEEVPEGSSISISKVAELYKKRHGSSGTSTKHPQITILAEGKTVAEGHAYAIRKELKKNGFEKVDMPPDVRSSEFSQFDALSKKYGVTTEHTLVIGWDPPMIWMHNSMDSSQHRRFLLRSDEPTTRVRMTLVTSNPRTFEPPIALLWRFVEEVEKAANILRNIIREDPLADWAAAQFLVRYFGLGDERADPSDLAANLRHTLGYLEFCAYPSVRFFGPFIRSALG